MSNVPNSSQKTSGIIQSTGNKSLNETTLVCFGIINFFLLLFYRLALVKHCFGDWLKLDISIQPYILDPESDPELEEIVVSKSILYAVCLYWKFWPKQNMKIYLQHLKRLNSTFLLSYRLQVHNKMYLLVKKMDFIVYSLTMIYFY